LDSTAPQPRSFVRVAVDDISRLGRITNVLIRYGFLGIAARVGLNTGPAQSAAANQDSAEPVDVRKNPRDAARRFRQMLEELGPTFVKVGQILSTRRDLLPAVFVDELSLLQDQVPPLEFSEVKIAVEKGLDGKLEDLFSHFDESVLASASIAETHLARLPDGTEVVVKVQRPGIADTIRSDLDLLFLFAKFLEATIAEMELYAPGEIVAALEDGLTMELDFYKEASNLEQFAENFANNLDVKIPKLFPSHCGRTILTMERVKGRKVADIEPESEEGRHYTKVFIETLYLMIFEYGFFHADPHPGNCFITDEGQLALIDFGLCGYLTHSQQDHLVSLIVAVIAGDVEGTARHLLRMGRPLGHVHMGQFKAEVSKIRDKYLRTSIRKIDAAAFSNECIDAAQRFRIRLATEYALLVKSGATIEGIVRTLDPNYDILGAGQMYARRMLATRYSSPRMAQEAFSGLMSLSYFLKEVPDQLSQILMDAESGTLRIRLDNDELKDLNRQMNTQTTRLFMGLCCAALTIATPMFLANEPLMIRGFPVVTIICALTATWLCWLGLGWHLFAGRVKKIRLSPLLKLVSGRWQKFSK
jgi:ubiquinone biosynthesis protein